MPWQPAIPWLLCGVLAAATACEAQRLPDTDGPSGAPGRSLRPDRDVQDKRDAKPAIHAAFDRMLRAVVRDERVDYLAVRDRHWAELNGYLDALAKIDPGDLKEPARLAFYINLYNATMIHTVAARLVDGYTVAENEWGVFKEQLVRLNGKTTSLDALENQIIRKQFSEPRIHVALVCGARSCPPILEHAYDAEDLSETLEANMTRFVNDASRNKVTADKTELSQIFNWYQADFGGENGVVTYLERYARSKPKSGKPKFLEYSWDLNAARPASGSWVVLKSAIAGMRKGEIVAVEAADGDQITVRKPHGNGTARVAKQATRPY